MRNPGPAWIFNMKTARSPSPPSFAAARRPAAAAARPSPAPVLPPAKPRASVGTLGPARWELQERPARSGGRRHPRPPCANATTRRRPAPAPALALPPSPAQPPPARAADAPVPGVAPSPRRRRTPPPPRSTAAAPTRRQLHDLSIAWKSRRIRTRRSGYGAVMDLMLELVSRGHGKGPTLPSSTVLSLPVGTRTASDSGIGKAMKLLGKAV
ncbi:uncharacterized protein [Miscanthus floridulus]|uniref:uncharacterized protein n=1 Tax=Miscanthus floridulus TaxID=154761 RepID=UPI00345A3D5D